MAINSVSANSLASALNQLQSQSTANERGGAARENVGKGGDGSLGAMLKPTVNASGHSIGTTISTKA